MAWIYLAESEDSRLPWKIGSSQLPIVKTTDTAKPYCCPECQQEKSHSHPFGMTCGCLLPITSMQESPSTSYMEASLARTLVLLDLERAWEAEEVVFSSTSRGLSRKLTRDSFFSKTSQQLELVASTVSSKHLPSSGMIVGGRLYQPTKLAPRTYANDGSFLPTPMASDYGKNNGRNSVTARDRYSLATMARHNLWPTPRANDAQKRGDFDATNRRNGLPAAVKLWPTLKASQGGPDYGKRTRSNTGSSLPTEVGGKLNPAWVEWLMGYPSEWTALKDWAMQWFLSKRRWRSKD